MKKLFLILIFFTTLSYGQIIKMQSAGYKSITTVQRDALTVPTGEFWMIYNSTASQYEYWDGGSWNVLETSGTSSPLTTKGDLYVFGTDNDRLAVSSVNGQVLMTDQTETFGVKWGTAGVGDVLKDGTQANNQVGVWTGDGTIEGTGNMTYNGTVLSVTGAGTFSGAVTGSNLNIAYWDTAYGWGDHSVEGYITNAQETDQVYVASQASNIDAGDITNLGNLSGENSGDQNLNDHFAITGNYETLLADKDRKGLITSSVDITLNDFGTSTDAEFQMYFYNRSGVDITISVGTSPQQYTDQYGTGTIPDLPDGAYAYVELVADNVWSLIIGGLSGEGGTGAVTSVNGKDGIVVLDPDDLDDTSTTNKFVTSTDITNWNTNYLPKDMNTLTEASYTTDVADKGAYVTISSGNITLDKSGLPDGFNQIFYNDSGSNIIFAGDAVTGVNNPIPNGYHATIILNGTTWQVSTPSSGISSNDVESVNTKTGVVVLDTDDILEGTNKYNVNHTGGDVTGATTLTIGANKILESHLKAVNAPTDEWILTYEATTGDFEWQEAAGAGATNLGYTASALNGIVTSDTGDDATIPLATISNAGLLDPDDKVIINNAITEELDNLWVVARDSVARLDETNVFTGDNNTFEKDFTIGQSSLVNPKLNFDFLLKSGSNYFEYTYDEFTIYHMGSNILQRTVDTELKAPYNTIARLTANIDGYAVATTGWTLDQIDDAGGGNVSNVGTPLNAQLAVWTGATTIEGTGDLRFDGTTFTTSAATISGDILTTDEMRFSASNQIPQGEIFYDSGINGIKIQADNILQFGSPTVETNPTIVNDINLYTTATKGLKIDSAGRSFGTGNSDLAITSTSDDTILITKSYGDANYNSGGDFMADGSVPMTSHLDMGNKAIQNVISVGTNNTSFALRTDGNDRFIVDESSFKPNSHNTYDLGTTGLRFSNGYFVGIDSSGNIKADTFQVDGLNTAPSSKTAAGTQGDIIITATYIYICTVTGADTFANWNRVALDASAW